MPLLWIVRPSPVLCTALISERVLFLFRQATFRRNFHGFCCFARVLVGTHRTHRARRPACSRQRCRARSHGQTPGTEKAQEGALLRPARGFRLPYDRHPITRLPRPVVVDAGAWRNIPLLRIDLAPDQDKTGTERRGRSGKDGEE